MSKDVWIDKHPSNLPGFGLAQVKAEGTTVFYDFDGYDVDLEWEKYWKLRKRFWKTKRVKREIGRIEVEILAYEKERIRRGLGVLI